uniref:EGF-like domain-containing protein n=1 Tax=Acrobeloides nanus TaxID=290746 RepID=A0A914E199_9BILA
MKVKHIKDERIEARLNGIIDDKLIKQKSNFIYSSAKLCQYSTSELVYSILGLLFLIKCSNACLPSNKNRVIEEEDPQMSALKKTYEAKDCPDPFREIYCFNGGKCYAEYLDDNDFIPFCKCQINFEGRRCEHIYHEGLYLLDRGATETAALSIIVVLLVIAIFLITCLLYYYRKVGREQELYSSKLNSTAITPEALNSMRIQANFFSQLSTVSQEARPFIQPQFSVGETPLTSQELWVFQKSFMEANLPRAQPMESRTAPIASIDDSI